MRPNITASCTLVLMAIFSSGKLNVQIVDGDNSLIMDVNSPEILPAFDHPEFIVDFDDGIFFCGQDSGVKTCHHWKTMSNTWLNFNGPDISITGARYHATDMGFGRLLLTST